MTRHVKPVHRKVIASWYDSEAACLVLIILFGIVLLFGLAGMSVARESPEFIPFRWVPALLTWMGGLMIVSLIVRWATQFLNQRED